MTKKLTEKNLLIFLFLASAIALTSAYIAQYIFDYQPCILCLHQRKPFFAIIALTLLSLVFFKSKKAQKFSLFLCILFLGINVALAFYHVGVEQKIFRGPSTCQSTNLDKIESLEELKIALMGTKAVRCDEPSFIFLGLSMAAWNLFYCLSLLTLLSLILRGRIRNRFTHNL